jgi:hypothetical protein
LVIACVATGLDSLCVTTHNFVSISLSFLGREFIELCLTWLQYEFFIGEGMLSGRSTWDGIGRERVVYLDPSF